MSGTKCTFVFVLDAKLQLSFSWFLFSHSLYGWSSNFCLKSSFISLRTPDLCSAHRSRKGSKVQTEMPAIDRLSLVHSGQLSLQHLGHRAPGPQCHSLSHSDCSSSEISHSSGSCCLHECAQSQPPKSCAKHFCCLNWKVWREKEYLGTTAPEKKKCVEAAPTTTFCSTTCSPSVKNTTL